jgi:DNA-binding transcriptional LysR family regulator
MQIEFAFMQAINVLSSDDLLMISAISKSGHLGEAAKRLGVDHSTLFRRLEAMESRLGLALFFRVRGRYQSTPSGQACVVAASQWTSQVVDLVRGLDSEQMRAQSRLRITTTEDVANYWLPKCLVALRSKHRRLVFEVHVDDKNWDLASAEFDIAIRPTRTPPEGWVGVQVGKIEMAVYGNRRWLETAPSDRAWLNRELGTGALADHTWMSQSVKPESVVAYFNSASALLAGLKAGLGVALLPCFVGIESGVEKIGNIPINNKGAARLWLLCHPALRRDQRVRSLFSTAREVARL